jgi:hypothetical protein
VSSTIHSTVIAGAFAVMLCLPTQGQEAAPAVTIRARPLITQTVDESRLTTLKGNTHPLARPEFDLGTAPANLPTERMLLVLKRSPEQETALRKLLDDQQDQASPNHHQWLTPEQFGKEFGPTDSDLQTITAWLQSHGFQVGSTKGRTVLEFSGTASQVRETFHTAIHKYIVKGEQHWANASDPQIPTALTPAVAGVLSLHNFLKKPQSHLVKEPAFGQIVPGPKQAGKKPQVTFPAQNGQPATNALGPADYATIYNINPVYTNNIGGNGVTIGVVARSNLYNNNGHGTSGEDLSSFRSVFNLPGVSFPNVVLNGPDPGDLGGGEEAEVTLDTTWSAALAYNANIDVVVSASTDTTDGIDLSEVYIVENNIADIMTESFSSCELYATDAQLAFAYDVGEQAAAQGITYLVSTGDNGAEGCDDPSAPPATHPISVNLLASTPFNVAVGGTLFNENRQTSKYWGTEPPVQESAISYIPENVWNESSLTNGLWAGSGGASAGNVGGGLGGTTHGVAKPAWQSPLTLGIPNDGVRDLPDVSLTAAGHDAYLLCLEGSCIANAQGQFFIYLISGTSASTPAFASIMALVDQKMGGRQGQANYVLYRLAATQNAYPSQCNGSDTSAPPAATCIFNDVTVGNNVVPGEQGTQYPASAGYDLATGLGSLNVANLVSNWNTVTFNPTTTTLGLTPVQNITHGQPVQVTIAVAPNSGTGKPSGDASVLSGTQPGTLPQMAVTYSGLTSGAATFTTGGLPGGTYNVWAHYGGDATYAPSDSNSVAVMVAPEPSTTTVSVLTADQAGNIVPFTNGAFGSFVYLRADVAGKSGLGIPTGGVTFLDGTTPIAGASPLTLNSQGNTATPNGMLNFDTGAHTISASYSGDASFNVSSTTQSQSFTITPGFYAVVPSAQSTVLISAPGSSGQSSVTISNSTGFNGTISLACTGLPSEANCTFNPPSIKANGTLNTTTATILVSTQMATAKIRSQRSAYFLAQWIMGMGLLFSITLVGGKQRRARACFLLLMLMVIVVVPSCGGGGGSKGPPPNPGTPTGTSNVVVTATSGSTISTSSFTLAVQ